MVAKTCLKYSFKSKGRQQCPLLLLLYLALCFEITPYCPVVSGDKKHKNCLDCDTKESDGQESVIAAVTVPVLAVMCIIIAVSLYLIRARAQFNTAETDMQPQSREHSADDRGEEENDDGEYDYLFQQTDDWDYYIVVSYIHVSYRMYLIPV